MKTLQRGNVIVGIIIGVVLGLAAALAVAVYVTKVPIPFLNKGGGRTAEQDAAEIRKNQNWDPNAPLYGKNPARPVGPAATAASAASASAAASAAKGSASTAAAPTPDKPAATASGAARSSDPLGDLAAARAGLPAGSDPFFYFVQAGAFRTSEDAESHRAKLAIMGFDAKITEREQAGRQVYRVRVGPFEKKEDADRQKDKLDSNGFETALVRVQR